jgi:hypothetical protein
MPYNPAVVKSYKSIEKPYCYHCGALYSFIQHADLGLCFPILWNKTKSETSIHNGVARVYNGDPSTVSGYAFLKGGPYAVTQSARPATIL